jgi:hypothetical protein
MYYRFYMFSCTTGADYIFYYRSTHTQSKSVYTNGNTDFITREDTCGVLEMVLINAYRRMQRFRQPTATCEEDLALMSEYWKWHYWGQDVMLICLEIQQRFLYDYVRE